MKTLKIEQKKNIINKALTKRVLKYQLLKKKLFFKTSQGIRRLNLKKKLNFIRGKKQKVRVYAKPKNAKINNKFNTLIAFNKCTLMKIALLFSV